MFGETTDGGMGGREEHFPLKEENPSILQCSVQEIVLLLPPALIDLP